MFKKLLLLVLGGVFAAGGFFYWVYSSSATHNPFDDLFSGKKIDLGIFADHLLDSDSVKSILQQSQDQLFDSPKARDLLARSLQTYAREMQGVELSNSDANEVMGILAELRRYSNSGSGDVELTPEQQAELRSLMQRGDEVFRKSLGVPLDEFLANLKDSNPVSLQP